VRSAPLLAALLACHEGGVIEIHDPDAPGAADTDAPEVVDTDRGGRPGDTEVAADSADTADTADTAASDTGGPSPFDAPRLAWDGRVVHDFTGYVGAYGCKATLVEQGEELAPVDVSAAIRAGCPTCTRFFQVRVQVQGTSCLNDWGQTEWRAVEPRPTGTYKIVEIYTGQGGGPVPRDPYPSAQLSGSTLAWRVSRSGFPIYQSEKVRGAVTLTPLP
jgi:hypothetical protein